MNSFISICNYYYLAGNQKHYDTKLQPSKALQSHRFRKQLFLFVPQNLVAPATAITLWLFRFNF